MLLKLNVLKKADEKKETEAVEKKEKKWNLTLKSVAGSIIILSNGMVIGSVLAKRAYSHGIVNLIAADPGFKDALIKALTAYWTKIE